MMSLPKDQIQQAFGRSVEDLETAWLAIEALCQQADQVIKHATHFDSTDSEEKARHARKVEILNESSCVLNAWAEFAHAAWVFATHGYQSVFFEGTPMAVLADVPDVIKEAYGLR